MTNQKIKKEFNELGYNLEHCTGSEGRGWYLRKHGTTNESFVGNHITIAEQHLFNMQDEKVTYIKQSDGTYARV